MGIRMDGAGIDDGIFAAPGRGGSQQCVLFVGGSPGWGSGARARRRGPSDIHM
jgi:hypothetical protein